MCIYTIDTVYKIDRTFPGGSVTRNLPANAGDSGLILESGRSPGKGNGNSLQYSCLGNPTDRGAWWAPVHGVARLRSDLVTKPPPWGQNEARDNIIQSGPLTPELQGAPFSNSIMARYSPLIGSFKFHNQALYGKISKALELENREFRSCCHQFLAGYVGKLFMLSGCSRYFLQYCNDSILV